MAETFELTAGNRETHGKAATRRLRRIENMVPATVYGAGKAPHSIVLAHKDVAKALGNDSVFSSILTLKIDDKKESVILKALQRHHTKPQIMHIDFLRINESEAITISVPIHFTGEEASPGVAAGGVVSHAMTEIEIKCLPANLPEALTLDISTLELDQSLHISNLPLPKGVELTILELDAEHDLPVVSVHLPKVSQEDLEAEAAEAALAAEAAAESAEETPAKEGESTEADDKEPSDDAAASEKDKGE